MLFFYYINKFIKTFLIFKIELYLYKNISFFINNKLLIITMKILKNHFKYYFKILTCISCIDFFDNKNRFKFVYELLSIKYNNSIRLKLINNEITPIFSIKMIFINAIWWEYECWDMFGVIFIHQKNCLRLLTDYGFQGFPLRKDFPIFGFIDTKFNIKQNKMCYNNIDLAQNFRLFFFNSPWEIFL